VKRQFLGEALAAKAALGFVFGNRQNLGKFGAPATVVAIAGHRDVALCAEGLHV
jgi:hypothetical protein